MRFEDIRCIRDKDLECTEVEDGMYQVFTPFDVTGRLVRADGRTLYIKIVVHRGSRTDFISAPEFILNKFGLTRQSYPTCSAVHDRLFYSGSVINMETGSPVNITQKEADYIFRQLLIHQGCPEELAHMMYKVLRNWGWFAWIRWRLFNLF